MSVDIVAVQVRKVRKNLLQRVEHAGLNIANSINYRSRRLEEIGAILEKEKQLYAKRLSELSIKKGFESVEGAKAWIGSQMSHLQKQLHVRVTGMLDKHMFEQMIRSRTLVDARLKLASDATDSDVAAQVHSIFRVVEQRVGSLDYRDLYGDVTQEQMYLYLLLWFVRHKGGVSVQLQKQLTHEMLMLVELAEECGQDVFWQKYKLDHNYFEVEDLGEFFKSADIDNSNYYKDIYFTLQMHRNRQIVEQTALESYDKLWKSMPEDVRRDLVEYFYLRPPKYFEGKNYE